MSRKLSHGNIAVYARATGTPKLYTDSAIKDFTMCAYHGTGNLLASNGETDGRGADSTHSFLQVWQQASQHEFTGFSREFGVG